MRKLRLRELRKFFKVPQLVRGRLAFGPVVLTPYTVPPGVHYIFLDGCTRVYAFIPLFLVI